MKKKSITVLIAMCALASVGYSAPLKTDLPEPQLMGTPNPKWDEGVKNLYKGKVKWPEVPDGVTNLAKGKAVTSSDDFPLLGELEFVTDGDKDAGEGYFVELGPGLQWVQVDLAKESEIHAIVVWHYHSQLRAYHDVVVQISNDPEFKKDVTTIFNNDYDNSAKLGKGSDKVYGETNEGWPIAVKGVKGQYVRLHSNGSTSGEMNHYIEVEVFGK
ncbi:MAG: hypothetical protein AAGA18_03320 [Verrucomicrobiota bacterium]